MMLYGGADVEIHVIFLISTLFGFERSDSRLDRITTGTHWIGGCVGPRICLEGVECRNILPLSGLELRTFSRPAGSQSLYRLQYPVNENLKMKETKQLW
jgi:hypothetical protein